MPGIKGTAQEAVNLGAFSISTKHILQLPATESLS
jgi:hypothetical protein